MNQPTIDVVMWTYNSERTLEKCLQSIDSAVPPSKVCHKIAVDGGSMDATSQILSKHGWSVTVAPRKGIPFQANYALRHVDTEYFAAFEHDIILNPKWFPKTTEALTSTPRVAAVQGLRLFTGSKALEAFEAWRYRTNRIPVYTWSIDNTLFRTDTVKQAGGFSEECMVSTDAILRENIFRLGYKWITLMDLISGHYRSSFYQHVKHQARLYNLSRYYWRSDVEPTTVLKKVWSLLGGNPINALRMLHYSRMLRIVPAQYILNLQAGIYMNILQPQGKITRRVPMDNWYLQQFKEEVMDSKRSISSTLACAVCGAPSKFLYSLPRSWGNIFPRLKPGIHREFGACSETHASTAAEKIFKHAFDYVKH